MFDNLRRWLITASDDFDTLAALRAELAAKSKLVQTLDQTIRDMEANTAWLTKELAQARERLDRIAKLPTLHTAPIGRRMAAIARGDA